MTLTPKTECYKGSFSYKEANLCNSLPLNLKTGFKDCRLLLRRPLNGGFTVLIRTYTTVL